MIPNRKNLPSPGPIAVWISLLLAFAASCFSAQGRQEAEPERTLNQMDAVRKTFHSFRARFSQKKYTAVLGEFDTPDEGEFCYARAADGSALLRQDATSPSRKILTVKGDVATFYQPDMKQAQIYSLGKYKGLAEFLALGIGQSPTKLQESFNIAYGGAESLNGVPCSVLILKPKAAKVAAHFTAITLWFKKSNGLPIQNKLLEPSGDYVLLNFFDEELNAKIPDSKFEQKLPNGVEIQMIQ